MNTLEYSTVRLEHGDIAFLEVDGTKGAINGNLP